MRLSDPLMALVPICGALLLAGGATAQPVNDDWENAIAVGAGTFAGTLEAATSDGGTSLEAAPGQPDVWYTYTAIAPQWLFVDTCGSSDSSGLDSVLSLHSSGPGTADNELIANDDWSNPPSNPAPGYCAGLDTPPSYDSGLLYHAGAGETVLIRVSQYSSISGGTGEFVLHLPEPGVATSLLPTVAFLGALGTRRRRLTRA